MQAIQRLALKKIMNTRPMTTIGVSAGAGSGTTQTSLRAHSKVARAACVMATTPGWEIRLSTEIA